MFHRTFTKCIYCDKIYYTICSETMDTYLFIVWNAGKAKRRLWLSQGKAICTSETTHGIKTARTVPETNVAETFHHVVSGLANHTLVLPIFQKTVPHSALFGLTIRFWFQKIQILQDLFLGRIDFSRWFICLAEGLFGFRPRINRSNTALRGSVILEGRDTSHAELFVVTPQTIRSTRLALTLFEIERFNTTGAGIRAQTNETWEFAGDTEGS